MVFLIKINLTKNRSFLPYEFDIFEYFIDFNKFCISVASIYV